MLNKKQIIIIGSKGMLGQMVKAYFSNKKNDYEIIEYNERFSYDNFYEWSQFILNYPKALIINCIGKIKQKTNDASELVWVNSILPLAIANVMSEHNYLIHPSTDCVFSGKKGDFYDKNDVPDEPDAYGWSKRLGEVALLGKKNVTIVRVSIIGIDRSNSGKGLLSWFLSRKDGEVLSGYDNHLWNGITTLEWCKWAEKIIKKEIIAEGEIIQLASPESLSKYDMLCLFRDAFKKNVVINKVKHEKSMDKRLRPDYVCETFYNQILEINKL